MAATARMILQVDPAEKARWTAEARKAGISTSEFVRRAAAEHDPELVITAEESEALKWATAEIAAAAARIAQNLDAIEADLKAMLDPNRDEQIRREARAALEVSGERLDLDRLRAIGQLRDRAA